MELDRDGRLQKSSQDDQMEKSGGEEELESYRGDGEHDEDREKCNEESKKSKNSWWRKISVEPAAFFFRLASALVGVQVSNLYIEKTCKVGSAFFGNGTTFSDEVTFPNNKVNSVYDRCSNAGVR